MNNWISFFFDSNACFGIVDNPKRWQEIISFYAMHHNLFYAEALDRLKTSRYAPVEREDVISPTQILEETPSFGFRSEHRSKLTLQDWAIYKGFDLEQRI